MAFTVHPIGTIRTHFIDRADAPRQPGCDGAVSEGVITLLPGQNFEQAAEDLDGFEYVWILAWFHLNENWKPKVRPPRGSAIKRGVFATRSPHRPNPLALSLTRLVEVKGRVIRVAEIDLVDGTPIIDIKPYLPDAEAHPGARMGWLARERGAAAYAVEWSAEAAEQCAWLKDRFQIDLGARVERVLSRDPRPHPYRRITPCADGFELAVKSWRVRFTTNANFVRVTRVTSGYTKEALSQGAKPIHDEQAQREFHARWHA